MGSPGAEAGAWFHERRVAACSSATSTSRQNAFTSLICSAVRQATVSSSGLDTTIASPRARDTATLSRLPE